MDDIALTNATIDGAWTLQSLDTAIQGRLHDGGFWSQANVQNSALIPNQVWRSGVVGTSSFSSVCFDMLVSALASPSLSLQVYPGTFVIYRAGNAVYQGYSSAIANITVSNADATNPRIDSIVARVEDTAISDSNLRAQIQVITGTPAGSPSAPAIPAGSVLLANVTVAANATTITNANISDKRKSVGVNGTVRRLLPGDLLTDVGFRDGELRDTGTGIDRWTDSSSSWVAMVRQDAITSDIWVVGGKRYTTTATLASGIGSAEALTNIDTGSLLLPANSFFRITATVSYQAITSSVEPDFLIRDTNVAGTLLSELVVAPNLPNPNQVQIGAPMLQTTVAYFKTTTAVTKTFVLTSKRLTGTGTISCFGAATSPSSMIVERVGASSLITDV